MTWEITWQIIFRFKKFFHLHFYKCFERIKFSKTINKAETPYENPLTGRITELHKKSVDVERISGVALKIRY